MNDEALLIALIRIAEALEERNHIEWLRLEEEGVVVDMPDGDMGESGEKPS